LTISAVTFKFRWPPAELLAVAHETVPLNSG